MYSEALAQLIDAGKRVIDSPVHLADFGKFASEGVDLHLLSCTSLPPYHHHHTTIFMSISS